VQGITYRHIGVRASPWDGSISQRGSRAELQVGGLGISRSVRTKLNELKYSAYFTRGVGGGHEALAYPHKFATLCIGPLTAREQNKLRKSTLLEKCVFSKLIMIATTIMTLRVSRHTVAYKLKPFWNKTETTENYSKS